MISHCCSFSSESNLKDFRFPSQKGFSQKISKEESRLNMEKSFGWLAE